MNHYVYQTTHIPSGKRYIGIRSTNLEPDQDPYLGSGVLLLKSIKKHGRGAFKKEILHVFPTRKEASDMEAEIVNEDTVLSETYLNLKTGGFNNYFHHPDTIEKIRKGNSKPLPQAARENMSLASPNNQGCCVKGKWYRSIREASRATGMSFSTITRRLDSHTTKFLDYYRTF